MATVTRHRDKRGDGWDCWWSQDDGKYLAVRDADAFLVASRTRVGRDRKIAGAPEREKGEVTQ